MSVIERNNRRAMTIVDALDAAGLIPDATDRREFFDVILGALPTDQGAVAALRAAPMPRRESTHGEAWDERYGEWWHAHASEAAIGGTQDERYRA